MEVKSFLPSGLHH